MNEFLRNFMNNRNWFIGTIVALVIIYFLINPEALMQLVNAIWNILQLVAGIALAIMGIRVILGYRPWWLGGGSSAKKKS